MSDNLVAKLGDFDFAIIDSVDSDSVDDRRVSRNMFEGFVKVTIIAEGYIIAAY